jgi:hypothetical protein
LFTAEDHAREKRTVFRDFVENVADILVPTEGPPPVVFNNGYGGYSQSGYSQSQYPYSQNPYPQNPYSQNPYSQNPYSQNPYSQYPYSQRY